MTLRILSLVAHRNIQRAAHISGVTVNAFIVQAATEKALLTLAQYRVTQEATEQADTSGCSVNDRPSQNPRPSSTKSKGSFVPYGAGTHYKAALDYVSRLDSDLSGVDTNYEPTDHSIDGGR